MELTDLFAGEKMLLPTATYVLVWQTRRIFGPLLSTPVGKRIVPALPLVYSLALAFIGVGNAGPRWQDKLVLGLFGAFTSMGSYKVIRTSLLGRGIEPDHAEPAPPAKEPEVARAEPTDIPTPESVPAPEIRESGDSKKESASGG